MAEVENCEKCAFGQDSLLLAALPATRAQGCDVRTWCQAALAARPT